MNKRTKWLLFNEAVSVSLTLGMLLYLILEVKHWVWVGVFSCILFFQILGDTVFAWDVHRFPETPQEHARRWHWGYRARDLFISLSTTKAKEAEPYNALRSSKFLIGILISLQYIFVLLLYIDSTGEPNGQSTCTGSAETAGQIGKAYNPAGYFNADTRVYTSSYIGKFCTLGRRYAFPNPDSDTHYIQGYQGNNPMCTSNAEYPVNLVSESVEINGNPLTWEGGQLNQSCATASYPDPTLGYELGTQRRYKHCPSSASQAQFCVLTSAIGMGRSIYEQQDKYVRRGGCTPSLYTILTGYPQTICPACLQFERWASGKHTGPDDYKQCAEYNADNPSNPFCALCPSYLNPTGVTGNCISPSCIQTLFIVDTVYTGLWFLDFFVFLPCALYFTTVSGHRVRFRGAR